MSDRKATRLGGTHLSLSRESQSSSHSFFFCCWRGAGVDEGAELTGAGATGSAAEERAAETLGSWGMDCAWRGGGAAAYSAATCARTLARSKARPSTVALSFSR